MRVVARLAAAMQGRVGRAIGLLVVVVAGLWIVRRPPAVRQPVAFNHRKHTEQLKLDCLLCHKYEATGAHAGLPSAPTCVMCHQVPQGTTAEAARLTALLTRGEPLQFVKLFRLPPHVYFSHRRHVGIAKLPCEDCHGAIAHTERPPERALVTIRMRVCLGCHRHTSQSVDCVACHR